MAGSLLQIAIIIITIPIALLRPFTGVLIYLLLSFGRPADFLWAQHSFDYLGFVAGACLIGYIFVDLKRSPVRLRGMTFLLLLWVWLAIVSATAFDPSIAYPKLWEYSRGFIMAFLTASIVNSEKRAREALYVLAVSLGVLGLKGALDGIHTGFSFPLVGPGGMMAEANEYALALDMGIPMLLVLSKDQSNRWVRIAFRTMAAASALVVIGTRSRSGLCGLITVGLIMAAFSKRKLLMVAGLALAAITLMLFGPQGALDRYRTIPTAATSDASAIGRLQAWSAAIKMVRAHPLVGVGLRNFVLVFPQYSHDMARVTHNAVFEMLAETGIPGCCLFVGMIFATVGGMFLLWRRARRNEATRYLGSYCQIVMVVLIVYFVPNMFINRQDFDLMYQLIALGAALAAVTRERLVTQHEKVQQTLERTEIAAPLWELWQRARG
jgi:probable O-glycosylation ligase (exosortase A-associated)